jgi:hypothetical protein
MPGRRRGRGPAKQQSSTAPDGTCPKGSESDGKSKSRKRSPNWEVVEITVLIEGKKMDHSRMLEVSDNWDHMEKADSRWAWICEYVMRKTHIDKGACNFRDKDSCRDKWQGVYGNYKRIYDYLKGTGIN